MLRHDNTVAKIDLDRLMELAALTRELTGDIRSFTQIPAFLATALGTEPVTFALLRIAKGEESRALTLVSPLADTADGPAQTSLEREIIQLAEHADPSPDAGGEIWREHLVIRRQANPTHRMLVLVRPRVASEGMSPGTLAMLQLLCTHIAKSIGSTLSWSDAPDELGDPFDKLTEREWVVLCGLNSEDGEKQLADRLGLSPHTLHSHIKSIYRKIGVQGRLPLLQRFHRAQREYRLKVLAGASQQGEPVADRVAG